MAEITHPRFKSQWLRCYSVELQEKVRQSVIYAAQREAQDEDILIPHESEHEEDSDFFDFGPATRTFARTGAVFRTADPEAQIIEYTKEQSREFLVLDKYPLIKKLVVRYNTPLPSSAIVERLFSYATMLDLLKCNRLSDSNFEIRVLSVVNAKYGKISK